MKTLTYTLFALLLFTACGEKKEEAEAVAETMKIDQPTPEKSSNAEISKSKKVGDQDSSNQDSHSVKKIIKDGEIEIKSNDLYTGKKEVDQLLQNLNGYYEYEEIKNEEDMLRYELKIRLPAQNFEKLIENLEKGKNEITKKKIQARDVTTEHIDIETRLNNKKKYLNRFNELLSKSTTIKDILSLEENIRKLQEEIESQEGQLKYLNDQVNYSTLHISIFKIKDFQYKPIHQHNFWERLKNALANGWISLIGLIIWLISLWPYFIISIGGYYLYQKYLKKP